MYVWYVLLNSTYIQSYYRKDTEWQRKIEAKRLRPTCIRLSLWMIDLNVHRVVQSSMDGVDRVVHVKSVDALHALRVPVRPEYVVFEQRNAERVWQI